MLLLYQKQKTDLLLAISNRLFFGYLIFKLFDLDKNKEKSSSFIIHLSLFLIFFL